MDSTINWFIVREDFVTFGNHEILKSHVYSLNNNEKLLEFKSDLCVRFLELCLMHHTHSVRIRSILFRWPRKSD
jgi:hypothetical protein